MLEDHTFQGVTSSLVVDSEGRSKAYCVQMAEYFGEKAVVISGW